MVLDSLEYDVIGMLRWWSDMSKLVFGVQVATRLGVQGGILPYAKDIFCSILSMCGIWQ